MNIEFQKLIESNLLFPIDHIDHNVPEYGKQIEFIGCSSSTGIKHKEKGYVLGVAKHKPSIGRNKGWMEVVFIDRTVYGLFFEDVNFIK